MAAWSASLPTFRRCRSNATTHAGSRGQLNGIEVILDSQGDNAAASEDSKALTSRWINPARTVPGRFPTMSNDTSGRPPQAFATIGIEDDLLANGPGTGPASSDPEKGNRIFLWLVGKASPVPTWSACQKKSRWASACWATETVQRWFMSPPPPAPPAAAAPAWPGAGTVADGGVTWGYGEPYAVSFGRGIALDGQRGQPVRFGTGFSSNAAFYRCGHRSLPPPA